MSEAGVKEKSGALPLVRTPKQQAALEKQAQREAAKQAALAEDARAAQLAQIVNLHIGGYSLAQIGSAIGATADEVDRMLAQDAQRYVRNQPALRLYVRNYISDKYSTLLEAVWDEATDKAHPQKLENQDRALRILKEMKDLHGAAAPTQTEVQVDAAPETVQKMVEALARSQGVGYDADIFDAEIVDDLQEETHAALDQASRAVGAPSDNEADDEF